MADTPQAFETITASDIVNRYFAAYETQDKAVIDELLSENFTFTGPNDDHIDKALYFEKCWQFSNNSPTYRFEKLVASPDGDVFVLYECTVRLETFRNTEFFRISDNQIKAIEVFFGSLPENGTKKKEISFYDTMISVKR